MVAISMRKDVTGNYRVAWKSNPEGVEAFYVATFDEAIKVARRMQRNWEATERAIANDLRTWHLAD